MLLQGIQESGDTGSLSSSASEVLISEKLLDLPLLGSSIILFKY